MKPFFPKPSFHSPNRRHFLSRRRFLKGAGATLGGVLGLPLYGTLEEAEQLEVVRRKIALPGWPVPTELRLGHLSDFHCQNERAVARTTRAVALLLQQQPDIVLLTGDYLSVGQSLSWLPACTEALAPLAAVPQGAYAVLGNHDWYTNQSDRIAQGLADVGITVLQNRSVPLPQLAGLWLVGIDSRLARAADLAQALSGIPTNAPKLLLVHEPDFADECPPGFLLQLSGHSHGGQVRLPGLPPLYSPRFAQHYPEGWQQGPFHPLYVTRGVGMMHLQMRFCCPPEVTVLTVLPGLPLVPQNLPSA